MLHLSKKAACLCLSTALLFKNKTVSSKETAMLRINSGMFGMLKAPLLKAGQLHRKDVWLKTVS